MTTVWREGVEGAALLERDLHRTRSRALTWHSAVVGVGWCLLVAGSLVLAGDPADRVGRTPAPLAGLAAVGAVLAWFPLLWPFYLAIGLYELGLADEIRGGSGRARRRAVALLRGLRWLLLVAISTVVALILVVAVDPGSRDLLPFVSLAWVPFALGAAGNESVLRTLERSA